MVFFFFFCFVYLVCSELCLRFCFDLMRSSDYIFFPLPPPPFIFLKLYKRMREFFFRCLQFHLSIVHCDPWRRFGLHSPRVMGHFMYLYILSITFYPLLCSRCCNNITFFVVRVNVRVSEHDTTTKHSWSINSASALHNKVALDCINLFSCFPHRIIVFRPL